MRRWVTIALAFALALASCRCGERKPAVDASPPDALSSRITLRDLTPERRLPRDDSGVVLPRFDGVELLDPGKGKRARRRYQPRGGERELVVTADVTVRELERGTWSERTTLPTIRYGLGIRATAATAPSPAGESGQAEQPARPGQLAKPAKPAKPDKPGAQFDLALRGLVARVGDGGGDPASPPGAGDGASKTAPSASSPERLAKDFLERYRTHVERERATAQIDERGVLADVGAVTPATSGDPSQTRRELQQLLIESVVVLPEQPIGVGARWRVTWLLRRGAAAVKQVATYELVAVAGDRLTLSAHVRQIGERQIVTAPELPASVTAELVILLFDARGTVEVDLASFAPARAELAVEYRVHSQLRDRTAELEYFSEMNGTVRLEAPAPAPAPDEPAPTVPR